MTELESAARAYVAAREGGHPTTTAYRRLRRAWVAAVRAEALMTPVFERNVTREVMHNFENVIITRRKPVKPTAHRDIEWGKK